MADLKPTWGESIPSTVKSWWKDLGSNVYALVRAVVLIDSSGTEIGTADNPLRANDAGPAWTSVYGVSGARVTSADMSGADAALTDAPTAGQKLVVTDVLLSADTTMRVDLKEETTGTVLASAYVAANSTVQVTFRGKLKLATADKRLLGRTSVAGNVAILAGYYSEA